VSKQYFKMKKILSVIILLFILSPSLAMDCSNKKIIDYMVVGESYTRVLNNTVKDLIKSGWQPFGGVIFSSHMGFFQVMVKYEDNKNAE